MALETPLVGLLQGVDIVVVGGSNTLIADGDDILRAGDVASVGYPVITNAVDGNLVAVLRSSGEYSYVGRLSVDFDASGVLITSSIKEATSGAFATDEVGVLRVTGATDLTAAIAGSTRASEVKKLTDAVQAIVTAKDSNIVGRAGVYLEGRREAVRTQETNFGNLTVDVNLSMARSVDSSVQVSLKNGGGIRSAIGSVDGYSGELGSTAANPTSGKLAGEIPQLDVENSLRFNNQLSIVTVTAEGLWHLLEQGVAASGVGLTPSSF